MHTEMAKRFRKTFQKICLFEYILKILQKKKKKKKKKLKIFRKKNWIFFIFLLKTWDPFDPESDTRIYFPK